MSAPGNAQYTSATLLALNTLPSHAAGTSTHSSNEQVTSRLKNLLQVSSLDLQAQRNMISASCPRYRSWQSAATPNSTDWTGNAWKRIRKASGLTESDGVHEQNPQQWFHKSFPCPRCRIEKVGGLSGREGCDGPMPWYGGTEVHIASRYEVRAFDAGSLQEVVGLCS